MSEWQPIETAPRDGARIFCYAKGRPKAHNHNARVAHQFRVDRWNGNNWWRQYPEAPYSHWMPLPAPPAFPQNDLSAYGIGPSDNNEGMTLRDWFAGQALPSIVAATSAGQHNLSGVGTVNDMIAQDAYRLADAMLEARK